jgi:hypothetical protein
MKSVFSIKLMGFGQPKEITSSGRLRARQYIVFTEIELFSLAICIMLDIIEYAAAVLTMPMIGDVFDVIGILFCVFMFRWIGLVSLMELLPGADVFPIYIITWLVWYLLRK